MIILSLSVGGVGCCCLYQGGVLKCDSPSPANLRARSERETGASARLSLAAARSYKMADSCLPAVSLSQDGARFPFVNARCLPSALLIVKSYANIV